MGGWCTRARKHAVCGPCSLHGHRLNEARHTSPKAPSLNWIGVMRATAPQWPSRSFCRRRACSGSTSVPSTQVLPQTLTSPAGTAQRTDHLSAALLVLVSYLHGKHVQEKCYSP